jgi:hypothetical protein
MRCQKRYDIANKLILSRLQHIRLYRSQLGSRRGSSSLEMIVCANARISPTSNSGLVILYLKSFCDYMEARSWILALLRRQNDLPCCASWCTPSFDVCYSIYYLRSTWLRLWGSQERRTPRKIKAAPWARQRIHVKLMTTAGVTFSILQVDLDRVFFVEPHSEYCKIYE